MKRISLQLAMATVIATSLALPAYARVVYCTNCSARTVQAVEKVQGAKQLSELYKQVAEAVKQTQQQIQLVQTTFQQYQNMVQNTAQLPQSLISQIKGQLTQLAQLTGKLKTQRGDLTSLGQIFNELFPGQEIFEGLAAPETADAIEEANEKYRKHWDEWSAKVDEAAQATFQLSGAQLDDMTKDANKFQSYLDSLLATPDGQMKALMSANQLSAMQIQEARQLRELIATTTQSNVQSQMKAEKESQVTQELWRKMTDTKGYQTGRPVPKDPF